MDRAGSPLEAMVAVELLLQEMAEEKSLKYVARTMKSILV